MPRPGSNEEGDGWLLVMAHNTNTGKAEVHILEALVRGRGGEGAGGEEWLVGKEWPGVQWEVGGKRGGALRVRFAAHEDKPGRSSLQQQQQAGGEEGGAELLFWALGALGAPSSSFCLWLPRQPCACAAAAPQLQQVAKKQQSPPLPCRCRSPWQPAATAQNISRGPVATIHLPHHVPAGLHGSWEPTYLGPDPADETVPRWQLTGTIRPLD